MSVNTQRFDIERRGSTYTCAYKDPDRWPLLLIARKVYPGTDRLLATLTLARRSEKGKVNILILTSRVDLLVTRQRIDYTRECTKRLKPTIEGGSDETIQTALNAMVDGLQEHLQEIGTDLEMISAADIVLPKDLTPPYTVWPIVPVARPGMILGPSGQGKSGVAAAIGLSVVTGKSILPRIDPKLQGPVFYIGQEETQQQWGARLAMICRAHRIEIPRHYYYLKLTGASLIDSSDMLQEKISTHKAALVIVDSAQATWGTETDNVRGYASSWYNAVDELGCPALIVEHPNLADSRKPQNGNGAFAAGSSVKRDRVGHQWQLASVAIPAADGAPFRYHVTMTDVKRNYVAKQDDITFMTEIRGYETMHFVESGALTAETIIQSANHLDYLIAESLRHPDEDHKSYGYTAPELQELAKQKDDKRVREALRGRHWRVATWNPNNRFRFEQIEGTGGHVSNPARWALLEERTPVEMPEAPGEGGYDA